MEFILDYIQLNNKVNMRITAIAVSREGKIILSSIAYNNMSKKAARKILIRNIKSQNNIYSFNDPQDVAFNLFSNSDLTNSIGGVLDIDDIKRALDKIENKYSGLICV